MLENRSYLPSSYPIEYFSFNIEIMPPPPLSYPPTQIVSPSTAPDPGGFINARALVQYFCLWLICYGGNISEKGHRLYIF